MWNRYRPWLNRYHVYQLIYKENSWVAYNYNKLLNIYNLFTHFIPVILAFDYIAKYYKNLSVPAINSSLKRCVFDGPSGRLVSLLIWMVVPKVRAGRTEWYCVPLSCGHQSRNGLARRRYTGTVVYGTCPHVVARVA